MEELNWPGNLKSSGPASDESADQQSILKKFAEMCFPTKKEEEPE